MSRLPDHLTIGELSHRSGVAPSALRFYEDIGLVSAERTSGNQRRYPRHMLRRVAFIRAAQRVGLTLDEVHSALRSLPAGRTPTKSDWQRVSGLSGSIARSASSTCSSPRSPAASGAAA